MIAEHHRLAGAGLAVTLVVGAIGLAPPVAGQVVSAAVRVPVVESTFAVDTVTPPLAPASGDGRESSGRLVGGESDIALFTTIGATYVSRAAAGAGRVRVHTPSGWAPWFELHGASSGDHGPDPAGAEALGSRAASDPVWVGEADGYQLSLPADATEVVVHLVRPTGEVAPTAPAGAPTEAAPGAAPRVLRREAWGARPFRGQIQTNRRLVRGVVHHTVTSNDYAADEVPSILRAIQAYHQDTRGWSDIAYNFIVDRFGRIWEARARSYERAVVSAASSGANEQTLAVSYLGDVMVEAPPALAVRAIGRTLGWKLRKHGLRPTRANIVGHRDVGSTDCPGDVLYRQLPAVERVALRGNPPPGPFFDVPWTWPSARAVAGVAAAGVIPGFDDGRFLPAREATRADAYVWLWRLRGSPPGSGHPFTDIPAGALHREAVEWAADEGIVRGLSATRFGGGRLLSRRAWVDLLWRSAGEPAVAVPHPFADEAPRPSLDWVAAAGLVRGTTFRGTTALTRRVAAVVLHGLRPFTDVPAPHVARAAVDWARAHVLIAGYADHAFRPDDVVTRRQASNWLWRFLDRPHRGPEDPTPGPDPLDRATAATWLWAAAGSAGVAVPSGYSDVPSGAPYEVAAAWSEDFGLFPDVQPPTFGATTEVTRAQFVRALFRLAQRPAAWALTPPGTVLF